jgi:4-carboxymuconolactone decarboxylase
VEHTSSEARLPMREPSVAQQERLTELGGRVVNLYRVLGNHPDLLEAWVEFAWALRQRCTTPRALRELVILRVAHLTGSTYEWTAHVKMARAAGVPDAQIEALPAWSDSVAFDEVERATLAYADAVVAGQVPDGAFEDLRRHFSEAEVIELTLTSGIYSGLARVLEALRPPIER